MPELAAHPFRRAGRDTISCLHVRHCSCIRHSPSYCSENSSLYYNHVHLYFWRIGPGFWIGFVFGTIGMFALALLSLIFPFVEQLSVPFLLPGHLFADAFAGSSASAWMVTFLYVLTGLFYALVGTFIDAEFRREKWARMNRL